MKLREIIKLSAIMLNLDEILSSEDLYDDTYDITSEDTTLTEGESIDISFNLLIRCFNLAYSEIATDYIPLIDCCKITVENGEYNLSNLTKKFYKLVKLEDKYGSAVKCNIYNNVLKAKDGEYNLIYCYLPSFATLNSDIIDFNGKVVDRIFAYGLNKEYCYICGMYDEANSYKEKFEDCLKSCSTIKKNLVLPRRRWE